MRWLEIIHISASPTRRAHILEVLKTACAEFTQLRGIKEAAIISHKILESEIALSLTWQQNTEAIKSKACLALAQYLESFGMVSHSIWISQLHYKGTPHDELS